MAKRKGRTRGPQTLATQAQYLLNQRRVKLWIPFLKARIAELQARIQEKGSSGEQVHSDHGYSPEAKHLAANE
jgi:CRISPR/Cas system-associated endonuclease Cas1